jgi:hypothetical protein
VILAWRWSPSEGTEAVEITEYFTTEAAEPAENNMLFFSVYSAASVVKYSAASVELRYLGGDFHGRRRSSYTRHPAD